MDSTDKIVFASLIGIVFLALISFWAIPSYEKGVWIAMAAVSNCLSAALGAKFGLAQAKKDQQ